MRKSKLQTILTKEILKYEYEQLGSMQKIADKLSVGVDSIYKYMKLYDIPYHRYYQGLYDCNEDIFAEDTEKSFYLAGFIAADGSLQKRKYSKILKIALSRNDKDHLEKIKILFDSNHRIADYKVKPNKLVKSVNYCSEIAFVSNKIFDDLARFNIVPRKTFIFKFPDWLIEHPLLHHFMRGYFDGDGCISHGKVRGNRTVIQGTFSILGTYDFVSTYNKIFNKHCWINLCKILKQDNIYTIAYSGNNNIREIYHFLYQDSTIYLDRKRDKFLNYVD